MKILTTAMAAIALAGCVTSAPPLMTTARTLNPTEVAAVQAGVKKVLKDPESARFGTISAVTEDKSGLIHVCGMVNAKNSFGGYTGEKPFRGQLSHVTIPRVFTAESVGGDEYDVGATFSACSRRGMPL